MKVHTLDHVIFHCTEEGIDLSHIFTCWKFGIFQQLLKLPQKKGKGEDRFTHVDRNICETAESSIPGIQYCTFQQFPRYNNQIKPHYIEAMSTEKYSTESGWFRLSLSKQTSLPRHRLKTLPHSVDFHSLLHIGCSCALDPQVPRAGL